MERSGLYIPDMCGDGMVLQRDVPARIWGRGESGRNLAFRFRGRDHAVRVDERGEWILDLGEQSHGGPFGLYLDGSLLIQDIWIGDVWLCSGQSNIERALQTCTWWPGDALTFRSIPAIRQLRTPIAWDFSAERRDVPGARWTGADSQDISDFSGAAFFMAADLFAATGVPQGIVLSAVGGSPASAWLPGRDLEAFPEFRDEAARHARPDYCKSIEEAESAREKTWWETLNRTDSLDYRQEIMATGDWKPYRVPGFWEDTPIGPRAGCIWFRRSFEVPPELAGKPARLRLGCMVDSDFTFINDAQVGVTWYQYPTRRYEVPEGLLTAGTNHLLIRVVSPELHGGFVPDKEYCLVLEDLRIDLRGMWECCPGAVMEVLPGRTFFQYKAMGLFNAMIAPYRGLAFRGVVWYQGESNTHNPQEYGRLVEALIKGWRRELGLEDLPFLLVQLPNFLKESPECQESGWAGVRDEQRKLLRLPHTGLVVTHDLGEWNDIHPLNKKDIGTRLALLARRLALGEKLECAAGPLPGFACMEGDVMVMGFRDAEGGLQTKGGAAPGHFHALNPEGTWVPVRTVIQATTIRIDCRGFMPRAIRYAWAHNPLGAVLCNRRGIPASCFHLEPGNNGYWEPF